jgi:chromosome segregation ATPase
MSLLDRLKSILKEDEQDNTHLEIQASEALEVVKNRKSQEISEINTREEKLIKEADELINSLREELEAVKEYEDVDGIKAAEDIAEDFYNSRKIALDNFNPDEESESYEEDLEDLLREFNDINRKEKALIERMKGEASDIAQTVQKLNDKLEEIKEFDSEERKMLDDTQELEENTEKLEGMVEKKQKLRSELDELEEELEDEKEDKESLKKQLEDLKEEDKWKEKQHLETEIEEIENDISRLRNTLTGYSSDLDRGLKKLIYQVENRGVEFNGRLKQLKKIREKEFGKLDSVNKDLEAALQTIEKEQILEGRQLEDFQSVVEKQPEFQSKYSKIQNLEADKEEKEENLQNLEIMKRRNRVEKRLEDAKENISKKETKIEEKRGTLNELSERTENQRSEIERLTGRILDADVEISSQ